MSEYAVAGKSMGRSAILYKPIRRCDLQHDQPGDDTFDREMEFLGIGLCKPWLVESSGVEVSDNGCRKGGGEQVVSRIEWIGPSLEIGGRGGGLPGSFLAP